jgi:hypothetical protein
MTDIVTLPLSDWYQACPLPQQDLALQALEDGKVLLLPHLGFSLLDSERHFLSAAAVGDSKNISRSPTDGRVRGSRADANPDTDGAVDAQALRGMMERYAEASSALLHNLLSHYTPTVRAGRTSFRPVEIEGRPTSWRKDDTRLHVDSFPSSPTHGERILRLFTNVHPHGRSRTWRLGEPFDAVARHYLPTLSRPLWGSAQLLHWLRVTKGRRSAYDHTMLQLHDRMKADTAYQSRAPQHIQEFAPGSSWLVYTDQVSHAAMAGQHAFEQTFYLPVFGMQKPVKSPLRVLERLLGRSLV